MTICVACQENETTRLVDFRALGFEWDGIQSVAKHPVCDNCQGQAIGKGFDWLLTSCEGERPDVKMVVMTNVTEIHQPAA